MNTPAPLPCPGEVCSTPAPEVSSGIQPQLSTEIICFPSPPHFSPSPPSSPPSETTCTQMLFLDSAIGRSQTNTLEYRKQADSQRS